MPAAHVLIRQYFALFFENEHNIVSGQSSGDEIRIKYPTAFADALVGCGGIFYSSSTKCVRCPSAAGNGRCRRWENALILELFGARHCRDLTTFEFHWKCVGQQVLALDRTLLAIDLGRSMRDRAVRHRFYVDFCPGSDGRTADR